MIHITNMLNIKHCNEKYYILTGVLNMKIKHIFKKWNDGNIDENNLYNMNKSIFDKMDNELLHIYNEQLFLLKSMDIILCDFDFENVRDNLIDLFNDNIDELTNNLIECVKKYKNTGVKYNETK